MIESIKQFVKMADYDAIINRIIIDETQIAKLQQEKENAEAKLMLFARKYEELNKEISMFKKEIENKKNIEKKDLLKVIDTFMKI
ncbi:MAG: hypothetical protein PUJ51_24925 [Clostridiales bacterium]|uniref:hypothetical protein n=1 Tax=Terrisporobacter sp. TaxID=1965305 RepID=UPI002A4FF854|nr:hypothetical protein [Terrisporobacter sp.]MDD7757701.1 hypothetical protein [Clostridiales bacterium]MDY4134605.1 hypothetical protein [Terrisporobacter sp.]